MFIHANEIRNRLLHRTDETLQQTGVKGMENDATKDDDDDAQKEQMMENQYLLVIGNLII